MIVSGIDSVKYSSIRDYSYNKKVDANYNPFSVKSNFMAGNNFLYYQKGNVTNVVSFTGMPKIKPVVETALPNFKMKVAAVSKFQDAIKEIAEKDVRKQNKLNFELDEAKREVKLYFDKTGKQIGFVHYEILDYVYDEICKNPQDFNFELTNVVKFPGITNVGLKARLKYSGAEKNKLSQMFDNLLEDPECKPITYPPIKPENFENLLKTLLRYEEQVNGTQSRKDMEVVIENIKNEIENPKNKNILIISHKEPDGDCVGCALGVKGSIDLRGLGQKVDVCIADRIPVLFKFLSNIKQIKMPNKSNMVNSLKSKIETLKKTNPTSDEIPVLEKIKTDMVKNIKSLPKKKIYDLVIILDSSSPSRLGDEYAKHIDPNKTKIIFIDHHPKKFSEWQQSKNVTNIDIDKANQNKLAWVADRVPAATELVSILAGKLNPKLNDPNAYNLMSRKEKNILKRMAAAIMTGLHTDTGSFTRASNLFSEDMLLPTYERPKYDPIGVAKWFSQITNHKITRNFIESNLDNQEYKVKGIKNIVRETLPQYAVKNEELQLGYVQIDNSYINNLWMEAAKDTPDITFKDVMGVIKNSSAFKRVKRAEIKKEDIGKIQDDTIAYLATKSSVKGELNSSGKIADTNAISFSFRSKRGTNHAAIIASLFGGGGHGAAAGGRLAGENISFDSKLLVLLDGKVETDAQKILKALNDNFKVDHSKVPEEQKTQLTRQVKVIQSPNEQEGKSVHELIKSLVAEIRKSQKIQTEPTKEAVLT